MITLTSSGRARFADATDANRHRRSAIVVDGAILSMPVVQERVPGGRMVISLGSAGNAAQVLAGAHALADALASGALRDDWEVAEQH
jgi:preprotein translocase subunit SecD